MADKILSFMGICRRAGKLVIGAKPVIDSVNAHKAKLVVFAEDFSHGSAKPVLEAVKLNNIKTITVKRSKDDISPAVGKLCGVAAVEDGGFAERLIELNENESGGELYD